MSKKSRKTKKNKKVYYAVIAVLYTFMIAAAVLLAILAVDVTEMKNAEVRASYEASIAEAMAASSLAESAAQSKAQAEAASNEAAQSIAAAAPDGENAGDAVMGPAGEVGESDEEEWLKDESRFEEKLESMSNAHEGTFVAESQHVHQFSGRILIGDSRTVMLQRAVDPEPEDIFIAKGAMSYEWFAEEAVPRLRMALDIDPNYAVVINMGVNDCANFTAGWREYFVNDYVDLINKLCIQYPTTYFYFASIGHIRNFYPSAGRFLSDTVVNETIDVFNSTMKNNCIAYYVDLCEYLEEDGYGWADNVHYNSECSKRIYDYVKEQVGKNDGPAAYILKE